MTDEELEMFRKKTTEFLNTQRCARPMQVIGMNNPFLELFIIFIVLLQ